MAGFALVGIRAPESLSFVHMKPACTANLKPQGSRFVILAAGNNLTKMQ